MKHRRITIDEEEIFESLRNVGIILEDSDCTEGLEVIDENGRTIILPENFNIFDETPYFCEKTQEGSQVVRMFVCVHTDGANEENKKIKRIEESSTVDDTEINCLAA